MGRWFAKDPLEIKYPDLSPYNFVANNPVIAIDPNGKEIIIVGSARYKIKVLKALLELAKSAEGKRMIRELANSTHKIMIYNDPTRNKNSNLGSYTIDGITYHEINFNPDDNTPFKIGKAHPTEEVERLPAVSIYHELRHSEQIILGIHSGDAAVIDQKQGDPIYMDEIDAVFGENIVRKELGKKSRLLYDGVEATNINGMKKLGLYEYDWQEGWAYEFTRGDYSSQWKTLNETTSTTDFTIKTMELNFVIKLGNFIPSLGTKPITINSAAIPKGPRPIPPPKAPTTRTF